MASKPLLHLITLADENAKSCSEFQAGGSDWEAGCQMDTLPRGVGGGGWGLQTPGVTESVCIARRLSPRLGSGCTEPERCGNQRDDLHS